MLVIVAVPTALDGTDQVVGPVRAREVAAAPPTVHARSWGAVVLSRSGRLGRGVARTPVQSLRRVASGGQVHRTVRPLVQAGLVTLVATAVLAIHRRRRQRCPVPPRQRGPDGSRAPPLASFACRASAAVLALGRAGGRDQGGTTCPSLPMT
jgi:hypothetical protein